MFTQPSQFITRSQAYEAASRPLGSKRSLLPLTDTQVARTEARWEAPPLDVDEEHRDAIGTLTGPVKGMGKVTIVVNLQTIFLIGREPDCDLILDYPQVSGRHLRLTPVLTNSNLKVVALTDLSAYGFFLNDKFCPSQRVVKIDDKSIHCKTYILKHSDRVRLPGCSTIFVFNQSPRHWFDVIPTPSNGFLPIFNSFSPLAYHKLGKTWCIHNFPLGCGSFGIVNLASHRKASWLQVACKTISQPISHSERTKITAEVLLLKRMNHPNINGILDLVQEDTLQDGTYCGRTHLILELMTGGDLFAYQEKHISLSEMETKWIASQLIQGLAYIHAKQIAHRDIKLENILVHVSAIYPRVVIGDFGHAITYDQVLETVPFSNRKEAVRILPLIGTFNYIPPERIKTWLRPPRGLRGMGESLRSHQSGEAAVGSRREVLARRWFEEEALLDAWALGVLLFIIASGSHPYDNNTVPDNDGSVAVTEKGSETSYTKAKGGLSWDLFRQQTGQGVLGTLKKPESFSATTRDLLQRLLDGCKVDTATWFQSSCWEGFSDDGIRFISVLLASRPHQRLKPAQALAHRWLDCDKAVLGALYDHVVIKGTVLHPDTAQGIFNLPRETPALLSEPSLLGENQQTNTSRESIEVFDSQGLFESQCNNLPNIIECDEGVDVGLLNGLGEWSPTQTQTTTQMPAISQQQMTKEVSNDLGAAIQYYRPPLWS